MFGKIMFSDAMIVVYDLKDAGLSVLLRGRRALYGLPQTAQQQFVGGCAWLQPLVVPRPSEDGPCPAGSH